MAGVTMEKVVNLCKRRGFVFPGSEIYGGLGASLDYGPLGVELKRNVKDAWWRAVVTSREDVVGIDSAIIMHPRVWEASGHLAGFSDPLVDCKSCKQRFRADHVTGGRCPACGGELTEPRQFNLMFKTYVGPVEDTAAIAYLRPETAQGIFVNFRNVLETSRLKIPFGIAQIGKSFRNEITPGNFLFRMREFEQMEMQYFVDPESEVDWFTTWRDRRFQWYLDLGMRREHLQFHPHGPDELAHYARKAVDIYYQFPFGWKEMEGIHDRTDFDLRKHIEFSGKDLSYFDDQTKRRFVPFIVETSVGADRSGLAFLADAYDEEEVEGEKRIVLRLHKKLAPVKAAVMPLSKKEPLVELAHKVHDQSRPLGLTQYDETGGSIGKRYRRQDEIGTPYCITVDFDSLEDQQVTIRERDSMQQRRVPISELYATLAAEMA
jgi:glycyl-tRNA synthetase